MSAADDMGLDAANRICQIEWRNYRSGDRGAKPSVASGNLGYKQLEMKQKGLKGK